MVAGSSFKARIDPHESQEKRIDDNWRRAASVRGSVGPIASKKRDQMLARGVIVPFAIPPDEFQKFSDRPLAIARGSSANARSKRTW